MNGYSRLVSFAHKYVMPKAIVVSIIARSTFVRAVSNIPNMLHLLICFKGTLKELIEIIGQKKDLNTRLFLV